MSTKNDPKTPAVNGSNVSAEETSEGLVGKIRAEHGDKPVDPAIAKKLLKAFRDSMAAVTKAEDEVARLKNLQSDAALALMQGTGAKPLEVDGVRFEPASRGNTFFYRVKKPTDALAL